MAYHAGEATNSIEDTAVANETYVVDDLTIVPLNEKSYAICELCSRIGRREQFYPRNNKFCSLRCHASNSRRQHCHWRFKFMEGSEHLEGYIPVEPLPQLDNWEGAYQPQPGPKKLSANASHSYEWKDELFGCDFLAAPVSLFKHAPLHEMWDSMFEGMKVEVRNSDYDGNEKNSDYLWVATVLKVKGYMGLLRYEGYGSVDSKDFWVNLCCAEVNPVGWCALRGRPLIPPTSIQDKYADWKKFLMKQLTGARTLPFNFYGKLSDSNVSRFNIGSVLEVLNKNRISQVKVATVCEIIGKRLHIKYYDSQSDDMGFWCHEDSPLIHPVGWAFRIGHDLDAPAMYISRVAAGRLSPIDTTPDMFYKYPTDETPLFTKGMKLEVIDPLNLSSLCAATIMEILNEGYMMLRVDCYPIDETCGDWFCYHQRSPCIFPVGFAMQHKIPLTPPNGYKAEDFSWEAYLQTCGAEAAPRASFAPRKDMTSHGFVAGMRLECTDLMDPRLVCVATIARVVSDLLKIHFDGWGPEYDQWLWAQSTDMYPVGWCRAVGHVLQGPNKPPPAQPTKRPAAKQGKAPRRRRKIPEKKIAPLPPPKESAIAKSPIPPPIESIELKTMETEYELKSEEQDDSGIKLVDSRIQQEDSRMQQEDSRIQQEDDSRIQQEEDSRIQQEEDSRIQQEEDSRIQQEDSRIQHEDSRIQHEDSIIPQEDSIIPQEDSRIQQVYCKMDVDMESKDGIITEAPDLLSEPTSESTQDFLYQQMDSSQDSQLSTDPEDSDKVIPKLVNGTISPATRDLLDVENWSSTDVAKFLTVNDCQPYCQYFAKITGPMMLKLTKDDILELLKMKVGPSLKIFDLIQQLKSKLRKPQCRKK